MPEPLHGGAGGEHVAWVGGLGWMKIPRARATALFVHSILQIPEMNDVL